MSVNGAAALASPHSEAVFLADAEIAVMDQGETWLLKLRDPFEEAEESANLSDRVNAPMPGKIMRISAQAGAKVKRGEPLVVLEAMKMEQTIRTTINGVVESIVVEIGQVVAPGQRLVEITAQENS